MPMSEAVAEQIAELLNAQNKLTEPYTAAKVRKDGDCYIVCYGDDSKVLGAVEVKKVQWYQCEIDHLSVHADAKGRGVGTSLVQQAEERAMELRARIVQCTIRVSNGESERLFKKQGFSPTVIFSNEKSGSRVTVYQKVLNPLKPQP